jgi:cupredoxin-like protein
MPIRQRSLRLPTLLAVLVAVAAGCAHRMRDHEMHHPAGYSSDVSTVQVVSALVGGKNVFIPSTIVVTDGGPRSLSVVNTTEMPHGFAIAALGIETVLPPGEEVRIDLPPLRGGQVLRIHCHMHPPHRSATLVVLPSK